MINRGEVLRCSLCSKIIAVCDENGPLVQGKIRDEHLGKVWMPSQGTHVCIGCRRKYVKGGGVAKDIRKEGEG